MIGFVRRRLFAAAVVVFAIAAVNVVAAGPANAFKGRPNGHVYNGASPRCLDSGVPQNAQLWNCSSSIYQQWVFLFNGTIHGNSPDGCLDDGAGLNGSGAFLNACNGSLSQTWSQSQYGYGYIVNLASGRCLDADSGTIGGQGTKVQVWDCNGGANQNWYFENVP
jgi:hypothetical protein